MQQLNFNPSTLTSNILIEKWPTPNHKVYYTLTQKESESGLFYNPRLLIIEDYTFKVCYSKHIHTLQFIEGCSNKNQIIKEKVDVAIAKIKVVDNMVRINYFKKEPKKWVFKFINKKLAAKWCYIFQQIQEKYLSKSIKESTKEDSKLTPLHEYSSILSKVKSKDTSLLDFGTFLSQKQQQNPS